jgi:hypothetical protein
MSTQDDRFILFHNQDSAPQYEVTSDLTEITIAVMDEAGHLDVCAADREDIPAVVEKRAIRRATLGGLSALCRWAAMSLAQAENYTGLTDEETAILSRDEYDRVVALVRLFGQDEWDKWRPSTPPVTEPEGK